MENKDEMSENAKQDPPYRGTFSNVEHIDNIVTGLMNKETHLSFSSLSAFIDSPRTFIDYKMGKKETTDAMLYGSMVHCLVLEPDDFFNRYFTIDDTPIIKKLIDGGKSKPRATTEYKNWHNAMLGVAGERQLVETTEYEYAKRIANDVRYNRASSKILEMANIREKPIEWEYMDFKFKGFIDGDGGVTFDLKTMADASAQKAQRQIVNDFHFLQQAMYKVGNGNLNKKHYIIAVDKKGGVSVHELSDRLMQTGKELYQIYMQRFHECILKNRWDESYDFHAERFDGIYKVDKPGWMY